MERQGSTLELELKRVEDTDVQERARAGSRVFRPAAVAAQSDGSAAGGEEKAGGSGVLDESRTGSVRFMNPSITPQERIEQLLKCPDPNPDVRRGLDAEGFTFTREIERAEAEEVRYIRSLAGEAPEADEESGAATDNDDDDEAQERRREGRGASGAAPAGAAASERAVTGQASPGDVVLETPYPADLAKAREGIDAHDFEPRRFSRPRLRNLSEFAPDETLLQLEMVNRVQAERILMVWISDLANVLNPVQVKQLGVQVSRFKNAQVLGLQNAGIVSLDRFDMPRLLFCDLSQNRIRQLNTLEQFCTRSPFLQALNVMGNPVTQTAKWHNALPERSSPAWRLLVHVPDLTVLNNEHLSVSFHAAAAEMKGARPEHRVRAAVMAFDAALSSRVDLDAMTRWDPASVRVLNLGDCGLASFHIKPFANLALLDLSKNQLTSLSGCGLEFCERLEAVSLTGNPLSKQLDLAPLSFLHSLRVLLMDATPFSTVRNYRLRVIHATRRLKGTDRLGGLQRLDDEDVTVEEKLRALQVVGKLPKRQLPAERWQLALRLQFGASQMARDDFGAAIRELVMPDVGLADVDVQPFAGTLEVLRMPRNALHGAGPRGLRGLRALRVLDLSGNAKLRPGKVLRELTAAPLTELRRVDIAPNPARVADKAWTGWLQALAPHNPRLAAVQGRVPSFQDRIEAARRPPLRLAGAALEQYRLDLAIVCSALPPRDRAYLPDDCRPEAQYRPRDVRALLRLAGLGLVDGVVSLAPFENLEKLNLAGNKLRDVTQVGLDKLVRLRLLDLRDNALRTKPAALGELFDGLPRLQAVAVRGNPATKRLDAARLDIIGHMQRMGAVECELRVIDSEVTVSERVEALKRAGHSKEEAEKLRADVALRLRTPRGAAPASVRTLDLEGMELRAIDLGAFTELRVLRLRGNQLRVLHGLGLERMRSLVAFDARDNPLDMRNAEQLLDPLGAAAGLKYLGLAPAGQSAAQRRAYRQRVIQALPRLRKVDCPLHYLDDDEIAADEVVDAMRDASEEEKERFRFRLVTHRVLRGAAPAELEELDLSGRNLAFVDLSAFTGLRRLSLAHNRLRSKALHASGLASLPRLEELDLGHNAFSSAQALGRALDELRHLRMLYVAGNKCFRDGSEQERVQLLAAMKRARRRGFALQFLNGTGISVDERCRGMVASGTERKKVERLRLDLTLEELDVDRAACTSLDLCNRGIADVALLGYYAVSSGDFARLVHLDLSENELRTLDGMRLHLLPALAHLDLRANHLSDLGAVVTALELCPALEVVRLQDCTEGTDSADPNVYVEEVCRRLRSVRIVDDIQNPDPLEYTEARAAEFLFKVCGVSPNSLVDVDLRSRGLSARCFFFVLAALRELQPRTVRLSNNDWDDTGVGPQSRHYRQYVVALLEEKAAAGTGRRLQSVDGRAVTDDEREAALEFLAKEEHSFGGETDIYRVMRGEWDSARFESGALQQSELDRRRRIAKEAARVRGKRGPGVRDYGKDAQRASAQGAQAGAGAKAVAAAKGARTAAAGALDDVVGLAPKATGSLLNKFELIIGFFQVYGLVLAITFDYDIPFPRLWVDLSRFYDWVPNLLSVDIDAIFARLDLQLGEHETTVKFLGAVLVYFVFMLLYWVGAALDRDAWVGRYITRWRRTACRAWAMWILSLGTAFGVGLALDPRSVDNLGAGSAPTSYSNTLAAVVAAVATTIFLLWNVVVRTFRHKYSRHRASAAFTKFWSRSKRNVQRASLFALTVGYMPVSRMVLTNFAGTYDDDALDAVGCVFSDSSGQRCCLSAFPGVPCISSPSSRLHWLHYASLVAGVVIVIGLPLFFVYLIRKGVEAVDVAGYEQAERRFRQRISVLEAELKGKRDALKRARRERKTGEVAELERAAKAARQALRETRQDLRNTYAYEVGKNPKAQSYLYQAYERKSRFAKILQMAEKLALVCIALYIPARVLKEWKVFISTCVVGTMAVTSATLRPFNDGFEDVIDIVSRLANTVNVGVSLGLDTGFITDWIATILLVGGNGLNVSVFAFSVIVSPIRACLARRRFLRDMARAKEAAQRRASVALGRGGPGGPSDGGDGGSSAPPAGGAGASGASAGGTEPSEAGNSSGAAAEQQQQQEQQEQQQGAGESKAGDDASGGEGGGVAEGGESGAEAKDTDVAESNLVGTAALAPLAMRAGLETGAMRTAEGTRDKDPEKKKGQLVVEQPTQSPSGVSRTHSGLDGDIAQSLALAQGTLDGTSGLDTVREVADDKDSMDGNSDDDEDADNGAGYGSGSDTES